MDATMDTGLMSARLAEARQLNDLLHENAQLTRDMEPVAPPPTRYRLYVTATIIVSALTVILIFLLAVLKPGDTATGTLIIGILGPITAAFLVAAIGHLGAAVDGRLSQLLVLTARAKKAEGRLEEKTQQAAVGGRRNGDPVKVEIVNTTLPPHKEL